MTIVELMRAVPLQPYETDGIPVAGPFRRGAEDWMLRRVLEDFARAGQLAQVELVEQERNDQTGSYIGISVWRKK